jgi:hypothetical protein
MQAVMCGMGGGGGDFAMEIVVTDQAVQVGDTPLHRAADGGHEAAIWGLLEAGANKEATNKVRG